MISSPAPTPEDTLFGHPKGLYICFFTELWERFSFYGMKALLFLYLTKYHLFGDEPSYDLLGAYGGLVYAVPVLGGLLADRYLGMRKAVILGGVLLVLGHLGMAYEGHEASVVDGNVIRDNSALQVFYASLALIIMGVGFLKPNISTIVGKLYPENDPRRDSGFTIFYAGINIGALVSSLLCGYLGETYGWKYGFGAAGIGMVFGLLVFIWGQKFLHGYAESNNPELLKKKIVGPLDHEWATYLGSLVGVAIIWQLIQRTWTVHSAMHIVAALFIGWFIFFLATKTTQVQRQQMLVLFLLILGNLIFFALYEQTYGSWVAFTDRMLTKDLFGFTFTAGSLTFLGAFFVVAYSPLFASLWPSLEKRGLNPSKPLKAAIGLALGGLAFIPLVVGAKAAGGGEMSSVWWLVLAYGVLAIGEMCLSPIGLSAVTELSVARVVSLMMGGWFLATAYSEVLAAAFGKLTSLEGTEGAAFDFGIASGRYADTFQLMVWIGLGSAVAFLLVTPLAKKWMHGVK